MTIAEIFLAIAAAMIIGFFFYSVFKIRGPWGSLWLFILILILVALAAEAWITPFGPEFYGFTWIPTLFVILIFAILIASASPPRKQVSADEVDKTDMDESIIAVSAFFWIFIIFLLIAVLAGIWFY